MTVKMEEFESTAVQTSRVTIKKMEQRIEELEVLYNREKSMHLEAATVLHKKERAISELMLQSEEDRKNIIILQESLDKLNEKIKMYKRQLEEQESISNSNIMRVKKFQRELESAENRAENAESTLNAFRRYIIHEIVVVVNPRWRVLILTYFAAASACFLRPSTARPRSPAPPWRGRWSSRRWCTTSTCPTSTTPPPPRHWRPRRPHPRQPSADTHQDTAD